MSGLFEAFVAAKKAATDALVRLVATKPAECCPVAECSAEEWDVLNILDLKENAARSALMPTERDALVLMHDCYERLKELGWREAIYCPKDGSEFDAIEAGSTAIHRCHYEGEWPSGGWWLADHGDLWPSRPILFRQAQTQERGDG